SRAGKGIGFWRRAFPAACSLLPLDGWSAIWSARDLFPFSLQKILCAGCYRRVFIGVDAVVGWCLYPAFQKPTPEAFAPSPRGVPRGDILPGTRVTRSPGAACCCRIAGAGEERLNFRPWRSCRPGVVSPEVVGVTAGRYFQERLNDGFIEHCD